MEVRQLQMFIALAEEKSFTKAAQRKHIVQSGLSTAIKELEAELGTKLFDRTTRRVVMTQAGTTFLEHARLSVAALEAAKRSVAPQDPSVRGCLCVGVLGCVAPWISLPKIMEQFKAILPEVKIGLRSIDNDDALEGVLSGDLDVSFYVPVGRRMSANLEVIPFRDDDLVAVCSADHLLASAARVSLEQLSRYPFIDVAPTKALRQIVDLHFKKAGVHRASAFEVDDGRTIVDLISKNLGVTIAQRRTAQELAQMSSVRILKISHLSKAVPKWRIALVRMKERNREPRKNPVDLFVKLLEEDKT